jgi:hypothetical protein
MKFALLGSALFVVVPLFGTEPAIRLGTDIIPLPESLSRALTLLISPSATT